MQDGGRVRYFDSPDGQRSFFDAAIAAVDVDDLVRQHQTRQVGERCAKGDGFFFEDDEWSSSTQDKMVAMAASVSQAARGTGVWAHPPPPPPLPQLPLARNLALEMASGSSAEMERNRTVLAAATPPKSPPPPLSTGFSLSPRMPDTLERQSYPASSSDWFSGGGTQLQPSDALQPSHGIEQPSDASHVIELPVSLLFPPTPRDSTPTQVDPLPDTQPRASYQL